MREPRLDRRQFLVGAASAAAATSLARTVAAEAVGIGPVTPASTFAAHPPAGFRPFTAPGRIARVDKPGSLRTGGLFPHPEAADEMVQRAVMSLTDAPDLAAAWRQFVHPADVVGIKVNGLGLRNMATNKEVVLAVIRGVMAAGVPAGQILVYDQWQSFLSATRLTRRDVPEGVRLLVHGASALGPITEVRSGRTQYARALLDCTAVIGVPLVKDHSLSGFTGALKNMTHGSIKNPEAFHRRQCATQIAELYAHDAIRSRVRLHVMDAFKVLYDRGPQDNPAARVPYEAVFAATDPVALDRYAADIVEDFRARNHLSTLTARGTAPRSIDEAARLGLGVGDRTRLDVRTVRL